MKNVRIRSFFWSIFSHIRTEYREIQVSLRIQSECGKIQTRKTPYLDTFHGVQIFPCENFWHYVKNWTHFLHFTRKSFFFFIIISAVFYANIDVIIGHSICCALLKFFFFFFFALCRDFSYIMLSETFF